MAENQENKPVTQKKSIFETLGSGVTNWFGMLTGKGARKVTETAQAPTEQTEASPQEDSVAEDMRKARVFISKAMSTFNKSAAPTLQKGKQLEGRSVEYAKKVVDVNFSKKAIRIFLVVFFGLIILFVASKVFKLIGGEKPTAVVATPTMVPTAPPFKRTEPSIYAEDKLLLRIEEDAKVLLNEIVGKNLDDDTISPPDLDINIDFLR